MNSIPLISNVPGVNFSMNRGNTSPEIQMRQEINTSLVALKKEAGTLEGLINEASQILDEVNNRIATLENDTVKKNDVVNVVQSGNMNPVTSNAVATSNAMPVNSVTSGNMHSVTSNAVASEIIDIKTPVYLNTYTTTGSNLILSDNIDIYKCLYFKVLINGVVVNTNLVLTTDKNTVFTIKYITDNNMQATVSFSFNKTKISITVFNTVTQLIVYGIK